MARKIKSEPKLFPHSLEAARAFRTAQLEARHSMQQARAAIDACSGLTSVVEHLDAIKRSVDSSHFQFSAAFEQVQQAQAIMRSVFDDADEAFRIARSAIAESELFREAVRVDGEATSIVELGVVPHEAVWELVGNAETLSEKSRARGELIAQLAWAAAASRLALSLIDCFGDEKLKRIYDQMIVAHNSKLYDLVCCSLPAVMERAVCLAKAAGEASRTFEWIQGEVGRLTFDEIGGYARYRVWRIILEHAFAQCWDDETADAAAFPNRNASAHGKGKEPASQLDSLNSILIANGVIQLSAAVAAWRDAA